MDDTSKDVERKIGNAYCPAKQLEENPIIEYCKYIIFEKQKELLIQRPEKFGGDMSLKSLEELEKAYATGKLHPMDLKKAVAEAINSYLEPVRKHFSRGKPKELLEKVKSFDVTR
jgi:tyrosyl-tRNA synthetase